MQPTRLDAEIEQLQAEIATAEKDCTGDFGEEVWASGAGSEVIRSVVEMSDASPQAKAEVLRREGLEIR